MVVDFTGKVNIIGYVLRSEDKFINVYDQDGEEVWSAGDHPYTIRKSERDFDETLKKMNSNIYNRYKNVSLVPLLISVQD